MQGFYLSDLHNRNLILNKHNEWMVIDSRTAKRKSTLNALIEFEEKLIKSWFRVKKPSLEIRLYCWKMRIIFLYNRYFNNKKPS